MFVCLPSQQLVQWYQSGDDIGQLGRQNKGTKVAVGKAFPLVGLFESTRRGRDGSCSDLAQNWGKAGRSQAKTRHSDTATEERAEDRWRGCSNETAVLRTNTRRDEKAAVQSAGVLLAHCVPHRHRPSTRHALGGACGKGKRRTGLGALPVRKEAVSVAGSPITLGSGIRVSY